MDACETLDRIAGDPELDGRLVHSAVIAAREERFADPVTPLHPDVEARLRSRGTERLWRHQAAAIDLLRAGENVVVATGTASGKSLCYQVPIVESVVSGERDTALLVFPTKALAQDQLRSIRSWLVPGLKAVTYDGDTATDDRTWARRNANVVLTNPEMLHVGILPSHKRWATFLMRLRYVVVDELHTLRGIFGSHTSHVLRRLLRVCDHYGSRPSFCFASATIGNPGDLASSLCGQPVHEITGRRVTALRARPRLLAATPPRRGHRRAHVGERGDRRAPQPVRRRRSPDARVHAQPARCRAGRAARPALSLAHLTRPGRQGRRVPCRLPRP
ncbi:MAG: DEAD/DEAH box helicase [Acidimicrobiia bacterium]|nr:DEAD/DEAH box helicase [Acidimicrobiia bacterium]